MTRARPSRPSHLAVALLAAAALAAGCSRPAGGDAVTATVSDVAPATKPHGDHNPHHGGVVMMNGDLHYEVVFDPGGKHRVYFSDAARADLPASVATNVTITIARKHGRSEPLTLQIDEAGESWVAEGGPLNDPDATGRVAYTHQGSPYWIDLPIRKPAHPAEDPHRR